MNHVIQCLLAAMIWILRSSVAFAEPTSCQDLLNSVASGKDVVRAVVSTLNLNGTASFAEFDLRKFPVSEGAYRLVGNTKEYFGDRKKDDHPFDPGQTDALELWIVVPVHGKPAGIDIHFNLTSHGGGAMNLSPQCDNDMIFGWGGPPEHARDVYYVIKLLR